MKVGDKVKLTKASLTRFESLSELSIGVVTKLCSSGSFPVQVDWDDDDIFVHSFSEVEVLSEERKMEVGDRVKFSPVGARKNPYGNISGVGRISSISNSRIFPYEVVWDSGTSNTLKEEDIIKVEEPTTKLENISAYKPLPSQEVLTLEVKFILDTVPGPWDKPEDLMRFISGNSYVQSVELVEKEEEEEELPETWSGLTDIEKGDLLLAAYNGEVVQMYSARRKKWVRDSTNNFHGDKHYRVKPL